MEKELKLIPLSASIVVKGYNFRKMKKFLKTIGILFCVLFAAIIIIGNILNILLSKDKKDHLHTLEGIVIEMNRYLPRKELYFSIEKIALEKENVIWNVTLDPTFFYPIRDSFLPESLNGGILPEGDRGMALDLDSLISNDLIKQSNHLNLLYYYLFVKTRKKNPFYEEIMHRRFSQIWRIESPFSDRHSEITMSYREMANAESLCINQPDEAQNLFMSEYIERQNRLLNYASGNADLTMHMTDDGNTLIFYCQFDKSYSEGDNRPILNLREQSDEIEHTLKNDVKTLPIFYDIKNICDFAGREFLFRYLDWYKTDSIDFRIKI